MRHKTSAPQKAARADKAASKTIAQQNGALHRERGHEPRRPVVKAEEPIAAHDQPIKEGRLVEIRLALKRGHDPLAARQHLAGIWA